MSDHTKTFHESPETRQTTGLDAGRIEVSYNNQERTEIYFGSYQEEESTHLALDRDSARLLRDHLNFLLEGRG